MSEDKQQRGHVRQREIKPREGTQESRGQKSGRQRGQSSNRKGSQQARGGKKPAGGQQGRQPRGGSKPEDKGGQKAPDQKKTRETKAQGQTQEVKVDKTRTGPGVNEKRDGGRSKRGSRKMGKQKKQAIRLEETVEDVIRDIHRIEKDIQIDLDTIRNQKLDL